MESKRAGTGSPFGEIAHVRSVDGRGWCTCEPCGANVSKQTESHAHTPKQLVLAMRVELPCALVNTCALDPPIEAPFEATADLFNLSILSTFGFPHACVCAFTFSEKLFAAVCTLCRAGAAGGTWHQACTAGSAGGAVVRAGAQHGVGQAVQPSVALRAESGSPRCLFGWTGRSGRAGPAPHDRQATIQTARRRSLSGVGRGGQRTLHVRRHPLTCGGCAIAQRL